GGVCGDLALGRLGQAMSYAVKEIFYTLQGEGSHAGRAAVFCRFAGCNLWSGREADRADAVCRFCDTDFVGTDGTGGGKFATADAQIPGHSLMFELSQTFYFEAAHTLERAIETASSRRIHGHTYGAEVQVRGEPGPDGMVVDLAQLRAAIAEVRETLDHHFLDD